MEVGTILYANLGWSAGIPTWWRVIKSTTKTVWIQQIKSRIIAHDGYGQNGVKVPVDELDERHKPFMRRIGKDNSVRIDDYSYAYEWDGEPKCFYTD